MSPPRLAETASAVAEIDSKREFPFSDTDFRKLADFTYQHTGISLSESKRDLVYNRLSRRLRALGLDTFREYHEYLEGPQGGSEKERFINSVSTNHTRFFREAHHFTHFRTSVAAPNAHLVGGMLDRRGAIYDCNGAQQRNLRDCAPRYPHPGNRHRH
jgi:chemotaxis protein methyltransferase CheR